MSDLQVLDPGLVNPCSRELLALIRYHLDYALIPLAYHAAAVGGVLATVLQAQAAVLTLQARLQFIVMGIAVPDPLRNVAGARTLPFQRNVGQLIPSLSPLELLMAVILDRAVVAGLAAVPITTGGKSL
jgi:hypothetical protein